MNFYFDENIPKVIARALNELEKERTDITVQSTEDVWYKAIKDPQLIEKLHEVDGILVTNDLKMKRNYCELLKHNSVSAFFIVFPNGVDFAFRYRQVVKVWEEIKKTAREEPHPFLCKIQNNGKAIIL
jgi:hypothetical protein